jgi:hypothetical protein
MHGQGPFAFRPLILAHRHVPEPDAGGNVSALEAPEMLTGQAENLLVSSGQPQTVPDPRTSGGRHRERRRDGP